MNILFVCTGNTCRSPMAEFLFKKMLSDSGKQEIKVESAGLSPSMDLNLPEEAIEALHREGVNETAHSAKGLSVLRVTQSDLILVMEEHHQTAIERLYPFSKGKVLLLKEYAGMPGNKMGISDPYGSPLPVYLETLSQIRRALEKVLEKI